MTMKEKLNLMREIKEYNDEMIRLYLSKEPIRRRDDLRYITKLFVKEVAFRFTTKTKRTAVKAVKAIPETIGLTIVMLMLLIGVPMVFSVIGG